jgi:hypothetical protein
MPIYSCVQNSSLLSPAHEAAKVGCVGATELLMLAGACCGEHPSVRGLAATTIAGSGNFVPQIVMMALATRATGEQGHGDTVLTAAVRADQTAVVKKLLRLGRAVRCSPIMVSGRIQYTQIFGSIEMTLSIFFRSAADQLVGAYSHLPRGFIGTCQMSRDAFG